MIAFIFPGQGSQYLEMAKDFYDNFAIAKDTIDEIEDIVSINLKKIIFSDNNELLNQTNYTQISIFACSVSIYKTLFKENNLNLSDIDVMLGHSLGEYTALACSNKLDLKNASLVLKKRGELMHNSLKKNEFGMAALIGLSVKEIEKIIKENKMDIEIANDNSPIQVVISGKIENLNNYENIFKNYNLKKFIKLNVSSAFHSHYMLNAQNVLKDYIEKLEFNYNEIKIISNFNSQITNDNDKIKNALKEQMASRVRWTDSIKMLEKVSVKQIIEIGPGKVLSGLIKRISSSFDIKSVNKINEINIFRKS